jgi:nucleotide-binding universal stress UspA family protein
MKALIGVDGSTGGFEATALAGQLLSPAKDQICFYYAPAEMPHRPDGADMRERAKRALAEAVFAKAREYLPEPFRAKVETMIGVQRPDRGLVVAAQQWRADLIVVGARGLGPIQRLLLGSVSQAVAHHAGVPVLIARHGAARQSSSLKMLLGFDRVNAEVQAEVLGEFTWPAESSGQVVAVADSMLAGPLPEWLEEKARDADSEEMAQALVREHDEQVEAKRNQLLNYRQQLPAPFQKLPPLVVEGHPAEQILKLIDGELFDLVIVGRTVSGAMKRMLMGSTSIKVLTHAPCSVLVIPPLERP